MKNPGPDTSTPVGELGAFGTTVTGTGAPPASNCDPPAGNRTGATVTPLAATTGSNDPPTGTDALADALADGDPTTGAGTAGGAAGGVSHPAPPHVCGGPGGEPPNADHFAYNVTFDDATVYDDPAAYTDPVPPGLSVHPANENPERTNDPVFPNTVTNPPDRPRSRVDASCVSTRGNRDNATVRHCR